MRFASTAGLEIEIVDRIGALALHPSSTSVAFIGGSLVPHGGHSPLGAFAAGCPVLTGPHLEHVESLVAPFAGSGAITTLRDAASLMNALVEQLALPPHERERQRLATRGILGRQRSAALRVVHHCHQICGSGIRAGAVGL